MQLNTQQPTRPDARNTLRRRCGMRAITQRATRRTWQAGWFLMLVDSRRRFSRLPLQAARTAAIADFNNIPF